MEIRAWDEEDLDWWIGLRRQWQSNLGEAQLRAVASGQVVRFAHRTVAWDGVERLGFAMIGFRSGMPVAGTQVLVAPHARGKGVGSRLWADVLANGGADLELMVQMGDDDPTSREVAEHWGFRVVSHAIRSRLDLTGVAAPSASNLFTVRILEEFDPPEAKQGLEMVLAGDTSPEAVELGWHHTVADFERMFPSIVWILVEDQGAPVAVASMHRQDDEAWLVIYTGVVPSHRGRGLARLAKEHLHALAVSRGARALVTYNEARNTGILAVNSRLGYQRTGGELRLIRTP